VNSERPRSSTPKKPPARIYTWGSRVAPAPPQGRGVGSDEADRLPQTVMDVQFRIPDPEIDSHVIR